MEDSGGEVGGVEEFVDFKVFTTKKLLNHPRLGFKERAIQPWQNQKLKEICMKFSFDGTVISRYDGNHIKNYPNHDFHRE
jgi:hypothetical protein